MHTETVTLPAFLASALVNGDTSGLSPEDLPWVERAIEYCAPGQTLSCEGEPFFSWGCDLPDWDLGADMLEFTVLYDD